MASADGKGPRATVIERFPFLAPDALLFALLVIVMFALFARVLVVRSLPLPPIVLLSGAAPAAFIEHVHVRAVAVDTVRERAIDAEVSFRIDGLGQVRAMHASPPETHVVSMSATVARSGPAEVFVDGARHFSVDFRELPTARVELRGVPWARDVQGPRDVPIYPLRPRASSFVDTPALRIDDDRLTRETLVANPGRIVDSRGRMLPIERSEVDVHLPPVVGPRQSRAELRAPMGAPVFIDVLLVEPLVVDAWRARPDAEGVPATVLALIDARGRGVLHPVEIDVDLSERVPSGSLLLIVAKSAPYPRTRGLAFAALVDTDAARATALLLDLVQARIPDDPLVAGMRLQPARIDDEVRRALLARLSFDVQGLPALGASASEQMAEAARAREASIVDARIHFRVVALLVFMLVIAIAAGLVWRARQAYAAQGDADDDEDDLDVPPLGRSLVFSLLAIVGLGAILLALDVVTRLAV
jgi:hypothetical protein